MHIRWAGKISPERVSNEIVHGVDVFGALARFAGASVPVDRPIDSVELFYNLAITPWARLTADLQVAEPSTRKFDTVIIPGSRLQVSL